MTPAASSRLKPAALLVVGAALGLALFTFEAGQGRSYFADDPTACANCHVMREQLATWRGSSHHRVTTCNSCHMAPGPVASWASKAVNGLLHSAAFTTGQFDEPIRARPFNTGIALANCRRCHASLMETSGHVVGDDDHDAHGGVDCLRCHGNVGHRPPPLIAPPRGSR